jgi:hypothetical protein
MEMVNPEFVKIREIRVLLILIRGYPCASGVKHFWGGTSLHFTTTTANANMGQQQLARSE